MKAALNRTRRVLRSLGRASDLGEQVEKLSDQLVRLVRENEELKKEVSVLSRAVPVMNEHSGALVAFRFKPAFERIRRNITPGPGGMLEEVDSDVGPLLFASFDRFIRAGIRETGTWEVEEAKYLRSVLHAGMTVLDVGANVGYTALLMAECVGSTGLVVALEPEPLNFQLLDANVRRNQSNVFPVHSAAGEVTGSIVLERSPDNAGDHRTAAHPIGVAPVEVPLVALDDLFPSGTRLDFVVIDAQGYDHRVIAGMSRIVEECRPPMLIEFWPVGIVGSGDDPDQVLDGYRELGYRMILLPDTDVTDLSPDCILAKHPEGKDHVTLALVPV